MGYLQLSLPSGGHISHPLALQWLEVSPSYADPGTARRLPKVPLVHLPVFSCCSQPGSLGTYSLDAGLQAPAPASVQDSANALLCHLCQHPTRCGAEPLTAAAPPLCSPSMALPSPILGTWSTGTLPHLGPWVAEGSGSSNSRLQGGSLRRGRGVLPEPPPHPA